ncbi:MAG TPA: tetratricopeptide repeat protein [Acidobacteriota bacterium]|nr:tetratricopeptide repeat protein [Acidobacteriota bacterium]
MICLLALALLQFPNQSPQPDAARLRAIWGLADKGENEQALLQARDFVKARPLSAEGLDLAGVLATRLGLLTEARDYLLRAVQIRPEAARILSNLSFVYLHQKEPAEAVRFLRPALLLDPSMADAWKNLAAAFAMLGDGPAEIAAKGFNTPDDFNRSPCAAFVNSLRKEKLGAPRLITFETFDPLCGTDHTPVLQNELPALVRFHQGTHLLLRMKHGSSGAWIFWSTPDAEFTGSSRLANSEGLKIELPTSHGLLYLRASRPVAVESWSIE